MGMGDHEGRPYGYGYRLSPVRRGGALEEVEADSQAHPFALREIEGPHERMGR